ncbi:Calcium-binding EF-hand [Neofusicoccum parvum]|uniref:Calcium-binding EF-hand n=1 Tax=Neofusicoccum parvum TaxID=310453 RepID=A0ACB5S9W7_9PEZI|nr:Calcium-binding EF-hand [Neofusicoccum parvum]
MPSSQPLRPVDRHLRPIDGLRPTLYRRVRLAHLEAITTIATTRLPPIAPPGTRRFKTVVMGRGRRDSRRRRFYTVLYACRTKREQYGILFDVADRNAGRWAVSPGWTNFDNLIAKPDAEYEIAFRLFDVEGTGLVRFDNFLKMYDMHEGGDSLPFDWGSLYIGRKNKRHTMTYPQLSQVLCRLEGEKYLDHS